MEQNKIIGALFDDNNGSWNKLNKDNVISIGIINNKDGKNYYQIDLSIQNEKLIKQLELLPKPDVIVASPPCEAGSLANVQQRIFREQTKNFMKVHVKEDIENNNKKFSINLKRDYFKQGKTFLNGVSTCLGLLKIIEHFKPQIGVIENPTSSKIWEFINENVNLIGYNNDTHYNIYNPNFSKKPTRFYSNIVLDLKRGSPKQQINLIEKRSYKFRSSIPKELLETIYKRLEEKDCE